MVLTLKQIRLIRKYYKKGVSERNIMVKARCSRNAVRRQKMLMNKRKKARVTRNTAAKPSTAEISGVLSTASATDTAQTSSSSFSSSSDLALASSSSSSSSSTSAQLPSISTGKKFVDINEKIWNLKKKISSKEELNSLRRQLGTSPSRKSQKHAHFACVNKKSGKNPSCGYKLLFDTEQNMLFELGVHICGIGMPGNTFLIYVNVHRNSIFDRSKINRPYICFIFSTIFYFDSNVLFKVDIIMVTCLF